MAFPTGWARKCPIDIESTKVGTGGVSNFTVFLRRSHLPNEMCDPVGGDNAQSNGGDIRFSSDAVGAVQLACHIDNFAHDSGSGVGDADVRIHVKVPALSDSVDTTIYVWYDAAGTESQPAITDTYGSKNAWDTAHCHRYSLDESPGGGAPQFVDTVGSRNATALSSPSSVAGQHGNAIDGNAAGYVRAPWAGHVAPNGTGGNPFTNTGICYIPSDDRLAIANFDDTKIHEVNKTTGADITSFSTLANGPTNIQGVAWNPVAARFAAIGGTSQLFLYQRNGTFDAILGYSGSTNGVAYDFTDNVYWVVAATGQLRTINTSTGATISTITLSGAAAGVVVEGITHNVTDNTLYISSDAGNMIYEINKSTGATIQSFRGPHDIEHLAYDHGDNILWVCGDARFHSGPEGGENVTYKFTPDGQPFDWRAPTVEYSCEWWWKPDNVGTTAIAISEYAAVLSGGFYIEVQTRATGIVRIFDSAVTSVDTAGSTLATGVWSYWRLTYDDAANTLTLFKNNTQVAQKTSAAYVRGSDGRIAFGARAAGTLPHNGAIDEFRLHNSKRSTAWWLTRYNNTSDPATFATVGTPAAGSAGGNRTIIFNRILGG